MLNKEEIEEAINRLQKLIEIRKRKNNIIFDTCICETKDIETVLEALENSIPKSKIEDKIKDIKNGPYYTDDPRQAVIEELEELLEDK